MSPNETPLRLGVAGLAVLATPVPTHADLAVAVDDRGFDEDARTYGEYIMHSGGSYSPQSANVERLRVECEHFVQCIREGTTPRSDGTTPRSDGHSGLRVGRVLEGLQNSLDASGSAHA